MAGIPEPNPGRVGACAECGLYRPDGRPVYLHKPGCSREGDLQLDRYFAELAAGDFGGPVLYATQEDADLARELGVAWTAVDGDRGLLVLAGAELRRTSCRLGPFQWRGTRRRSLTG